MTQSESKTKADIAWRVVIAELKFFFRWAVWVPIAAGGVGYLLGLSWITIVIASAIVTVAGILIFGGYIFWHLLPLRKWANLTRITDLIGFEEVNKNSDYMPREILGRQNIRGLSVMGNGCGKWTREVEHHTAVDAFRRMRSAGGSVRFLASCPIHLNEINDEYKIMKAKKNARSLLLLREFREDTKSSRGTFEIRTYKHVATLRLIILNETDCIVGHYQEDGNADSFDTPLLIFHHSHDNEWGFGGAFRRLFESEWYRATEPTPEEWKKMEELATHA
jgi:hypothetical protein